MRNQRNSLSPAYIGGCLHLIYCLLEERKKIIQNLFEPLLLSLVGQKNSSEAKRWNVIRNSYVKILSINYVVYSSDDGGCLFSELEQCHQIVLTIHHYTITHNDMSANIKTFDSVSISQTWICSIIRSPTLSLKSLYSFRSSLKSLLASSEIIHIINLCKCTLILLKCLKKDSN